MTPVEKRREFQRLYDKGMTDTQIAKESGFSVSAVTIWRLDRRLPRNLRPGGSPRKSYYVYRTSDDALIAYGSARICAKTMGISIASFYSAVSRARTGKRKGYEFLIEPMGGCDTDDRDNEPNGTSG